MVDAQLACDPPAELLLRGLRAGVLLDHPAPVPRVHGILHEHARQIAVHAASHRNARRLVDRALEQQSLAPVEQVGGGASQQSALAQGVVDHARACASRRGRGSEL